MRSSTPARATSTSSGHTEGDPPQCFESACAYCRKALDRSQRLGHIDHATTGGGNQLGNLILACSRCNGDEKLDQDLASVPKPQDIG